jgi:hypothetical protein
VNRVIMRMLIETWRKDKEVWRSFGRIQRSFRGEGMGDLHFSFRSRARNIVQRVEIVVWFWNSMDKAVASRFWNHKSCNRIN